MNYGMKILIKKKGYTKLRNPWLLRVEMKGFDLLTYVLRISHIERIV